MNMMNKLLGFYYPCLYPHLFRTLQLITRTLDLGPWTLDHRTWNLEPGTWNLELSL